MLNPWEILGIEPTSDKVLIKMTFAKLVKENPPEKDAAKYQEIREAYQQATQETKVQEIVQEERAFPDADQLVTQTESSSNPSASLNDIKKLRDNLFNQKTITFESLLKAIRIYPKSTSAEEQKKINKINTRERERRRASGESWDTVKKTLRIIYIIFLLILFFIKIGNY